MAVDQNQYTHAMDEDATTGKPMPKVGAQITGSKVLGPTLIHTSTYSAFTANSTIYPTVSGVLNRAAKSRTFIFVNSLNQAISGASIIIQDSVTGLGYSGGDGTGTLTGVGAVGTGGSKSTFYSGNRPSLAANGDSAQLSFTMGATAPTSGDVKVYVIEVL